MNDDKIYSGLAAFLVLAGLGLYGWMLKRSRNKVVRKVHLLLSVVWIPLLVLHAGGSVIVTAIVTAAVWAGAWVLEKTRGKLAVERV